jgi:glyoxylase-like metal-dependent hydrolase (beta-lactamase superfamily II)
MMKSPIKPITVGLLLLLGACSPSDENTANKAQSVDETANAAAVKSKIVASDDFPYAFEKVANNTWVIHGPRELPNPENKGFMNNPAIVETSAGLVVIDPGSTVHVGNNVLAEIRKLSSRPVVAVFDTHIHGDHWLANQAIKAAYPEATIYGHSKMLADIKNGEGENWIQLMHTMTEGASDGTTVVAPDQELNNGDLIKIGDTEFKIHHYGVAHTKTDIMIEVAENSVIFLGDNVLAKRLPRMSDGTFQGSIETINKILENQAQTWVPGHGPTGDRAMVEDYLNYLTLVYEAAQKTFADNLDSSDVITITAETTAAYKDWADYDAMIGPHGAQAYSEVEAAEF